MVILDKKINVKELANISSVLFDDEMLKAVVDIEKEIIAVDAELHYDLEQLLLEKGSNQECLWGINFYLEDYGTEDFVEFDSLINIRPQQNNKGRGVYDAGIQRKIL